jgi:POT family proton-dependent oligopeptide transporter
MSKTSVSTVRDHRTFFGHPAGLFILFFTEMWERFSYYGMRALLVLYMTSYLIQAHAEGTYVFGFGALKTGLETLFGPLATDALGSQIYGIYTALVYLTPLFGGILADRLLGQRKTVVVGGVIMAAGHFLMAIESMFLPALLLIIVGNGCFKPNVSTQVGSLYPEGDPRRDRAFVIFYMGINLGAFFAPLVCGTLGQRYGWHYGFGAAGVGMMFGLVLYLWGQKFLAEDQFAKVSAAHQEHKPLAANEWRAISGLLVLCLLNVVFWAVYEQQGNSLQLFADRNADWHILGWEMPSTWFQALNPMFIFMLAPLINAFWSWQALSKKEPSSVTKMGIGCFIMGASFLVLMYIANGMAETDKVNFLWLVASTFLLTLGELYLSPVGLSLVTKVAPVKVASMMMGVWFLANFLGNYLAGYLGMFYASMTKVSFFMMLMVLAMAAAAAIFALQKPLKRAVGNNV